MSEASDDVAATLASGEITETKLTGPLGFIVTKNLDRFALTPTRQILINGAMDATLHDIAFLWHRAGDDVIYARQFRDGHVDQWWASRIGTRTWDRSESPWRLPAPASPAAAPPPGPRPTHWRNELNQLVPLASDDKAAPTE